MHFTTIIFSIFTATVTAASIAEPAHAANLEIRQFGVPPPGYGKPEAFWQYSHNEPLDTLVHVTSIG